MNHVFTQALADSIMIYQILLPQKSQFSFKVFLLCLVMAFHKLEHCPITLCNILGLTEDLHFLHIKATHNHSVHFGFQTFA